MYELFKKVGEAKESQQIPDMKMHLIYIEYYDHYDVEPDLIV